MAIDTSQLSTDLANQIADLPTSFQFQGQVYSGSMTDIRTGHNLEPGGYVNDFAGSITARESDFGTLPTAGVTIGIGGIVYRVDRTSRGPADDGITLDLITPDK